MKANKNQTTLTAVYTERKAAQRAGREAKRSLLVPFGSKEGGAFFTTRPGPCGFWELVLVVPKYSSRTCHHCGESTLYGKDLLRPCVLCRRDMFRK